MTSFPFEVCELLFGGLVCESNDGARYRLLVFLFSFITETLSVFYYNNTLKAGNEVSLVYVALHESISSS